MKHSSLVAFLRGELAPEQFQTEINGEVVACVDACRKGGAGHIIVTEGPNTVVTRGHAAVLLEALATERLPIDAANYVADAVIMSDDFDFADQDVADAFHLVADDSAVPSSAEIREALATIS